MPALEAPLILTPDRVFVKAITTIKALSSRSNYGSLPRPPAENRIKLYGLYKQATEGNVEGIMTRPLGYTMEDEGAKKKWDAWKMEEGLLKTEAKRRYISYLIDTMKVYASGTLEARELLSELEYLWDQIKELQFTPEEEMEHHTHIPLPSHSPLFSQFDRYSVATPLPLASNYLASASQVPNQQYRNNLHKIYSHLRRSTMVSLNDNAKPEGTSYPHKNFQPPPAASSLNASALEDFKTWQGEINLIINRLSKEFLSTHPDSRSHPKRFTIHNTRSSDSVDLEDADPKVRFRRWLVRVLKSLGINTLYFLKNFSVSVLAILFLLWCVKKNVVVQRTLVTQPSGPGNKQKKELIINMVLNTNENKWFIHILSLLNSFVGFV